MSHWSRQTKEKNKLMELHQPKDFLHSKGNHLQNEKTTTEGEKILGNDTLKRGLINIPQI